MWHTECIKILRHMINDLSKASYDDERLQELFLVAAQFVDNEVDFPQGYTIDVDELKLTPDPTDRSANTRDDGFMNLVLLKSACILDMAEARSATGKSISFSEGKTSLDQRQMGRNKMDWAEKGWCAKFEDAKFEYQTGNVQTAGAAILGPYRVQAIESEGRY